jgi:ABC-type multidrug transport system ATPase subunit
VLGPSGAGKSLFLRAIADLDPALGEVSLDGRSRASMPAPQWRRQVALVPTESGWWADIVHQHFTDTDRLRPLLDQVGLPADAFDWPVGRLSSGERQRLALLRALQSEPRVLLLDEPTSALDRETTLRVEALLRQQLEAGRAILLATHDLEQANRLASARLSIRKGRASSAGGPA